MKTESASQRTHQGFWKKRIHTADQSAAPGQLRSLDIPDLRPLKVRSG